MREEDLVNSFGRYDAMQAEHSRQQMQNIAVVKEDPRLPGSPIPSYPGSEQGYASCPPSLYPYSRGFYPFFLLGRLVRSIYNSYYSGRYC